MNDDWDHIGRIKSSMKIAMCLDMTEACFRTCAAGIRAQNPGITDEELISKLQERVDWIKRPQSRGTNHARSRRVH